MKTRVLSVALVFGMSLGPVAASAQSATAESLEQTYGRLCGSGQQGETCALLRQGLLAKLSGQQEALAPASLPGGKVDSLSKWGHYAKLIGSKWLGVNIGGRMVMQFELREGGNVVVVRGRLIGGRSVTESIFRYNHERGGIEFTSLDYGIVAAKSFFYKVEADGSWVASTDVNGTSMSFRFNLLDDGNLRLVQTTSYAGTSGDLVTSMRPIDDAAEKELVPSPQEVTTAQGYDKMLEDAPAKIRERELAAVTAAAAAEAAANPKKGRGGLLRAAIGAGLGVAAANASGMDAAQTVGAAAKGVALMNPESQVAQVVGASGDAILQTSGLGTAPAATASAGSSSASYPTKPNVLNGQAACSMMNEGNYRQVGVSGGNDVQLKTMCAQGFEYYVMYKRAIAQGYSEADANRTYAAHQQAAQNAVSFYANNRAR